MFKPLMDVRLTVIAFDLCRIFVVSLSLETVSISRGKRDGVIIRVSREHGRAEFRSIETFK
jgi:hypothetical protein